MGFLDGKKALVSGVASNRSIAYGVAKCLHREGAELAFTYQTEKLKPRVEKITSEFGSSICIPLDVADDQNIINAFINLYFSIIHWSVLRNEPCHICDKCGCIID